MTKVIVVLITAPGRLLLVTIHVRTDANIGIVLLTMIGIGGGIVVVFMFATMLVLVVGALAQVIAVVAVIVNMQFVITVSVVVLMMVLPTLIGLIGEPVITVYVRRVGRAKTIPLCVVVLTIVLVIHHNIVVLPMEVGPAGVIVMPTVIKQEPVQTLHLCAAVMSVEEMMELLPLQVIVQKHVPVGLSPDIYGTIEITATLLVLYLQVKIGPGNQVV